MIGTTTNKVYSDGNNDEQMIGTTRNKLYSDGNN